MHKGRVFSLTVFWLARMKVLYLAPARHEARSLTAFTFVDEEIRALADAGIEMFVPTYARPGKGPAAHPNVHLCELRADRAIRPLRGRLPAGMPRASNASLPNWRDTTMST